jgi:hypothetical protein
MGDFLERLLASGTGDLDEDRSVLRPRPVSLFEPDPTASDLSVAAAPAPPAGPAVETTTPIGDRIRSSRSVHPEAPASDMPEERPGAPAPPFSPSSSPVSSRPIRPDPPRPPEPEGARLSPPPNSEPPSLLQVPNPIDLSPDQVERADVLNSHEGEERHPAVPDPSRPGTPPNGNADFLSDASLVGAEILFPTVPEEDDAFAASTPGTAATGPRENGDPIRSRPPDSAASRGFTTATMGDINRADTEPSLRHDDGLLVPVGSPLPVPAEKTAGQEDRRRIEDSRTEDHAAETVHVRIGTVEVRASGTETLPEPRSSRRSRVAPAVMSLDEYLKARARGGDR